MANNTMTTTTMIPASVVALHPDKQPALARGSAIVSGSPISFGLPKDVPILGSRLLQVKLEIRCEVPASELTLRREPNRARTVPA